MFADIAVGTFWWRSSGAPGDHDTVRCPAVAADGRSAGRLKTRNVLGAYHALYIRTQRDRSVETALR